MELFTSILNENLKFLDRSEQTDLLTENNVLILYTLLGNRLRRFFNTPQCWNNFLHDSGLRSFKVCFLHSLLNSSSKTSLATIPVIIC